MSFLTNIKSLWVIIIILIALNIFLTGSVWLNKNQRPFSKQEFFRKTDRNISANRKEHFLARQLNFNPVQEAEFDTLAVKHRARLSAVNDELKALREQLVGKMRNQEFDSASEKLIEEIGQKQSELELINFRNFQEVLSICDAEQKEKFIGIMRRAFRPHNDPDARGREFERKRNQSRPQ
jgi:hypothetical protein